MSEPLLDVRGISKTFGGAKALDQVDFQLREGEVHGLVGENGAGKSTLMKILAGVHTRYDGELRLRDRTVRFTSPKSAKAHGISMIYQELSSIGPLSVAENLCLGREPRTRLGFIDWKEMRRRGMEHLADLGVEVDVRVRVEDLSLGLQQTVEIARVTHSGADILIMDEPTSALSANEIRQLFGIVRTLKQRGKSVIFISHFLDDVLEICDRITVLRNGRNVATLEAPDLRKPVIIRHMLGTEARAFEENHEGAVALASDETRPAVLEVRNATSGTRLLEASFVAREGEILGLFGALGAGHTLVGECLYGLKRMDQGEIVLDGQAVGQLRPTMAKSLGIAYVSSDRMASLFPEAEIYKNITIAFLKQLMPSILHREREIRIADDMVGRLGIKAASSTALLGSLSGGNQQKVSLARWLVCPIRLLVLNEPTRGMDVGAKEEVMRIIKELKRQKTAVLLISSEPETVIANCDRIVVFTKGRIAAEFANEVVTKDMLMRC
jgi:ribose transport system ATP-binding protein